MNQNGIEAIGIRADISDSGQVNAMAEEFRKKFGAIDVLVNNAGIAMQKLITEMTDDEWKKLFASYNFSSS